MSEDNARPSAIEATAPPGWRVDDEGRLWRETIHSMTRRCLNWDYCGKGVYLITLVLNDRSRPLFGRVVCSAFSRSPGHSAMDGRARITATGPAQPLTLEDFADAKIELTELGARVEAHARRISEFSPEIEVVGVQMMGEHLHLVLRVTRRLAKPLGEYLRGFKIGATKIARELGLCSRPSMGEHEAARGKGLFADGFVDTILGDDEAVEKGVAYMFDNPRRYAIKRAYPDLFKVLGDVEVEYSPMDGRARRGRFAAIGNRALLTTPHILQVQVSRRDFAYKRDAKGEIVRKTAMASEAFEAKAAALIAAARHGAALVSPCISEGEREIARRAYDAGLKVITLKNKGFSPLYKPGGRLFEQCAAGNLLMLAPIAWPYLPGEKKITRMEACALNRIAQLIAGRGAAEINYKGYDPGNIDKYVFEITK